jgi:hypothetical protein
MMLAVAEDYERFIWLPVFLRLFNDGVLCNVAKNNRVTTCDEVDRAVKEATVAY